MSAGWENVTIGDVCSVIAGQSPKGSFYNEQGEGLPFYQGKKLFREKLIDAPTTWTTHVTKEAQAGDILMSVRAPVGPINFSTEKICIGRGLAAIRASDSVDRDYLFYILLSKQKEISGNEGAVFASINKKQIEEIEISLPSLGEQKRIVAILDEAFAGIDTAIANTEKNLANARELFESYLNLVFSRESRSTYVPLTELTSDITDGDHSAPPKSKDGIPFITISNIDKSSRLIDFSNTFKVPEQYFQNLKKNRRPMNGDVLFTVTGSYGIPVIVPNDTEFCFQRHIGLLRPKKGIETSWLYYVLLSPDVFRQATEGATGTAQKTVSLKVLRNIRVPIMNMHAQESAVKKLDDMWSETQRLEIIYKQKLASLKELKQSLLQKAFSGELTATKATTEAILKEEEIA